MQISTREGDWIVDTLSVREELEELNEVFTDPKIIKVSVYMPSRTTGVYHSFRYFTGQKATLYGYNKTSICIL